MRIVMIGVSVVSLAAVLSLSCSDDDPGANLGSRDDSGRSRDLGGADGDGSGDLDDAAVIEVIGDDTGGAPGDAGPSRGGGLVPEPESIFLSSAGTGTLQEQIVRVWNESDRWVVIHSAEVVSTVPGFSLREPPVEASREPGQAVGFALQYTAQSDVDATAEILVHHSFGPDPLVIPVSVASKVLEDACLAVSPTALDFGTVVRGRGGPVERTFSVTNCGTPDVTILRLDRARVLFLPTPSSFQWTPPAALPLRLAGGESADVTVIFTPGRAGTERGAIDVVANVDGAETTRVTLRATTEPPPLEELDVHLRLTWDVEGGSDVDLHFYPESGDLFSCEDCFYSNMSPDWGVAGDIVDDPFLDFDDLEGPGPENINVDELPAGTYLVAAHYYSDTGSGGGGDDEFPTATDATVAVFIGGTLAGSYGPQNLSGTDSTWVVARLEWPSGALTALNDVFVVNRGDYTWCSAGFGF